MPSITEEQHVAVYSPVFLRHTNALKTKDMGPIFCLIYMYTKKMGVNRRDLEGRVGPVVFGVQSIMPYV